LNDSTATLQNIRDELTRFRDERDWKQFHNPKDLSIAIAAEAGELLELFLWKSSEEVSQSEQNPEELEKISEELSDIFILG
jgi:dCTP diphosphatase